MRLALIDDDEKDLAAATEHFDLIILDIFMREMNGIQVAHAIRESDLECNIIFLTSSDAFMLDGYSVLEYFFCRHKREAQVANRDADAGFHFVDEL